MTSRDERDAHSHFSERYAIPTTGALADVERRVLGEAWGVNGYTTVAQADAVARTLRLRAGDRLLDVGTGRGYPALYLATKSGCAVIGTDMPLEALVAARRRAARLDLTARAAFVSAGGAAQPFRDRAFDAVVLTDVLC
jgi:methylase of polypeptide subunit release factors